MPLRPRPAGRPPLPSPAQHHLEWRARKPHLLRLQADVAGDELLQVDAGAAGGDDENDDEGSPMIPHDLQRSDRFR